MPVPLRKTLSLAVIAAGCAAAVPLMAGELSGPEIRALIGGEKVRLSTPFGIALPLEYRKDGVVLGDVSSFSMAQMLAPREEGRWWTTGTSLCQKWPTWYDGRQFCFKIT